MTSAHSIFFFEKNIHFNFFETFNVNRFDFKARIYDVNLHYLPNFPTISNNNKRNRNNNFLSTSFKQCIDVESQVKTIGRLPGKGKRH